MSFTYREKEHNNWLEKQKGFLEEEHKLKGNLRFIKKNLSMVQRSIKKNNDWLRRQV